VKIGSNFLYRQFMKISSILFLGLFVLSGVSCRLLEPKEDPSRYYKLRSVAEENGGGVIAKVDEKLAISVGPAVIPGYLDRQGLVSLKSENELEIAEFDLWGEGLDSGIARVIAQNLEVYLGSYLVMPFPEVPATNYDHRIPVIIGRFELNSKGEVELHASWSILDSPGSEGKQSAKHTKIVVKAEMGGRLVDGITSGVRVEDQVEAMSQALGELSRQIAKSLAATDR